jgi:uncharacterized membrane protein YtjA (UPF0391 family)
MRGDRARDSGRLVKLSKGPDELVVGTSVAFIEMQRDHLLRVDHTSMFIASNGSRIMLSWALTFFVLAIIAAIFGFGGIASGAASIAKILFVLFIVLFIVSMIANAVRGRSVV